MWWTSWILKAEPFAYGQLALSHQEFWAMTPAEYNDRRTGYYARRRAWLEDTAMFVATIINHMPMRGKGARTVKAEHILGPSADMLRKMEMDRKRKRRQSKPVDEDDD